MRSYDVKLNGKNIDTVFATYAEKNRREREEVMRRSLIDHDGYNPAITVKENKGK